MWGYEPCCFLTVSFSHAGAHAHMYAHTHSYPHNIHTHTSLPPTHPPTHIHTLTHPQHMYTYIYRFKKEGGNLVFVCVVTFTYTLCYSPIVQFCFFFALAFQWNLSSVQASSEEDELCPLQTSGNVVNSQEIMAATLSDASMNTSGDQVGCWSGLHRANTEGWSRLLWNRKEEAT